MLYFRFHPRIVINTLVKKSTGMEHKVKHDGRTIMVFKFEDGQIVQASEHWTPVYNAEKHEKSVLVQVLGEVAMRIGGRAGAAAVREILEKAPKTEVSFMSVRKYVTESGGEHRKYIERQILTLTEEIALLHKSLGSAEVDWTI